jgi:tRNA(Ile)-lysidine synthase
VSGGADSVAMLRAMHRLQGEAEARLIVGHVHHGLRGEAADTDANFVRELCQQLDVPCHVGHVDGSSRGDGIEAAARDARYQWLVELANSLSVSYIATAHTADDQVETIVHRIVRGTGVGGLAGIPATRQLTAEVTLVRPLLDCARSQVEQYLAELGQASCEDETNRDTDLTRNRIRHELLPLIEQQYNPQVREALLRLGSLAGEVQGLVDAQVAELFELSCIVSNDSRVILKPAALGSAEPIVVRELLIHIWKLQQWPLQAMGYDQWQRLLAMLVDPTAQAQTFPGPIRAEKQGEQLVLTRPVSA